MTIQTSYEPFVSVMSLTFHVMRESVDLTATYGHMGIHMLFLIMSDTPQRLMYGAICYIIR